MKLEYTVSKIDRHHEVLQRIRHKSKGNDPIWLSRLNNELVVIVRSANNFPIRYNWVWVSSHGSDGAYLSNTDQTAEQIATTIVRGDWNFQPNLKITLEDMT
jgi:hypothetical protein